MVRVIAGIVVAYLAIAFVTVIAFFTMYALLGVEGAFREGSYEPSSLWITLSVMVGVVAALLGGAVCALIARSKRAAIVLAGLLFAFGLVYGVRGLQTPREVADRPADVTLMEAMQEARTPAWMGFLNALIGATGVMVGATVVLGRKRTPTHA